MTISSLVIHGNLWGNTGFSAVSGMVFNCKRTKYLPVTPSAVNILNVPNDCLSHLLKNVFLYAKGCAKCWSYIIFFNSKTLSFKSVPQQGTDEQQVWIWMQGFQTPDPVHLISLILGQYSLFTLELKDDAVGKMVLRIPSIIHFVVVQLLSHVRLFMTPWAAACQASLSFTVSEFAQTYVH